MNPVRPPLANGTTSVCSCRPQDHEDPVPALNLQLIQYNLGAFRQQCPLSHSELRGIARSCPSSTPNPSAGKVPTLVCQYQLKNPHSAERKIPHLAGGDGLQFQPAG
jgi:hypothetical protein